MVSANREPITGIWSGGQEGAKPHKAENISAFECLTEAANFPHPLYAANTLNLRYLLYKSKKNCGMDNIVYQQKSSLKRTACEMRSSTT